MSMRGVIAQAVKDWQESDGNEIHDPLGFTAFLNDAILDFITKDEIPKFNVGDEQLMPAIQARLPKVVPSPPPMAHSMKKLLFGKKAPAQYPTWQARQVVEEVLPRVIRRFLAKNADYGENAQELGLKGQFADIWRKMAKLKRAWWEGQELKSEPATEVAEDLVGHLLLALLFENKFDNEEEWEED